MNSIDIIVYNEACSILHAYQRNMLEEGDSSPPIDYEAIQDAAEAARCKLPDAYYGREDMQVVEAALCDHWGVDPSDIH